ncbi:MAG: hemolysin family protein [Eubacteriales bacterium]|nr:hemolysin family protein [Eubacteriales bacterium]
MNGDNTILYFVLVGLILMSAYFSATETAFSTINKIRLKNMVGSGSKKAKLVLELADDYDRILSTILIGNNIVNIASASLATLIFVDRYGDAGVTISTIVMTMLVLVFGEISPKSLAKEAPESFAMFSAPMLKMFSIILLPLNIIFSLWKKLLSKIVRLKDSRGITEEELITMVEEATQDGEIEKHEGDLIRNAIEFNDLDVSDVLTPRTQLIALSEDDPVEKIHNLFADSEYSRLPVYRDTIDNIIGVIHLKDFFRRKSDDLSTYIKPVVHTTDTEKISKLLPLLQEQKCHLAVVADEYGGTMGIVTLEDIIEEIVGEIWDEHDEVIKEFEQIGDYEYLVNGGASVEKLFRIIGIDKEVKAATVNGWVTKQLGHWPKVGDSFIYDNLRVEVCEVEARKTKQVIVAVIKLEDED